VASGRSRWRTLFVVLGVLAVLVVAVAPAMALRWIATDAGQAAAVTTTTTSTTVAAAPPRHATTPLLSARRVPALVTAPLTSATLRQRLAGVATATPAPGCLVVEVDGAAVQDLRGDTPVIPASNQKLVTAAVALEALGGEQRFVTSAVAPAAPVDGVLRGDLTIVGGGDPVLTTQPYLAWLQSAGKEVQDPHTPYEALADQIVAAGVRRIEGSVVGNDGRYDAQRRVASWPGAYRPSVVGGPLSALLVDDGFTSFAPARSAADPAQHAAQVMTQLLAARGVAVTGPARSGPASGTAQIAAIASPPLTDVVREMLTTSDNNTAELLLKEIGLAKGGAGSTAAGTAAVTQTLTTWGVPMAGVQVVDGSGLDRGNRLTCHALVGVLDHGGAALEAGLAVAGQTGTLDDDFTNSPVKGRLRAKTGTLTGVKSLTGVVPAGDHRITFAYVLNAPRADVLAKTQWDRLGAAFAAFPDAPDLQPFLPTPPAGS
jgi:D-alanyl-D-alanine carboxypeptidase/D-alanyl-D-alanine-endopeptidase (penicillin-binding protein 4)